MKKTLEAGMTEFIGRSSPLDATVVDGGANFSLFSRTASGVELLFFDREEDANLSTNLLQEAARTSAINQA
jgi:glycogen operon protein